MEVSCAPNAHRMGFNKARNAVAEGNVNEMRLRQSARSILFTSYLAFECRAPLAYFSNILSNDLLREISFVVPAKHNSRRLLIHQII